MAEKQYKHKDARKLMKRNEFQELLLQIREYLKKNLENVVIGAVVAAVIIVAVPLYLNHSKSQEEKAEQMLTQANYIMNRPVVDNENAQMFGMFRSNDEKYEKAIEVYMQVVQTYKNTKSAATAYLGVANAYYSNGKYKEALEYYSSFEEKYPDNILFPDAISGSGYCHYMLGEYEEAVNDFSRIVTGYKGSKNYFDSKLKMADSYLKLKNTAGAKKLYNELTTEAKDTYWATAASGKLKKLN